MNAAAALVPLPERALVLNAVAPSLNTTLPEGVAVSLERVTVAVKVTDWLVTDGRGLLLMAVAVVFKAELTVCMQVPLLPYSWMEPLSGTLAVMVWLPALRPLVLKVVVATRPLPDKVPVPKIWSSLP